MVEEAIIVINCGSSSVKFALFSPEFESSVRIARGAVERGEGLGAYDVEGAQRACSTTIL